MPHLDISQLLKFHMVFDALKLSVVEYDIFTAIKKEILAHALELSDGFNLDLKQRKLLISLARNDRKWHRAYKKLGAGAASRAYAFLIQNDFIEIEATREKRPVKVKNQKLPKSQRKKLIQNKLHFKSNFLRFFFYFIEPNLSKIQNGLEDEVMEIVVRDFEHYCSLGFERLSAALMAKILNLQSVPSSLWIDRTEIDIFYIDQDKIIAGEAKYKGRKVCKNVLSQLRKKCEILGLKPNLYVLISASGFSKELLAIKDKSILLLDIKDFKELIQ